MRSWPDAARSRFLTSLPRELTFKFDSLVHDLAEQLDVAEALAPFEVAELDQDLDADYRGSELAHQPHGRRRGAAGGKNIIHDQHGLAGLDGIGVHLQRVGPVLEVVRLHDGGPRKLAGLADRDKARAKPDCHRRAGDEAARLDGGDQVWRIGGPGLRHQVDDLGENCLVAEERRDVAEDDALLRVIGDVADVSLQLFRRRHSTERKYSRVRASPSSRPTSGCQPSSSLACEMSGRRCFGSSTGRSLCSIRLFDPASRMIVSASSSTVTSWGLPRLTGSASPLSRAASTPPT